MGKRKFPVETFVQSANTKTVYYIYDYEKCSAFPYKILTLAGAYYSAKARDLQQLDNIQQLISKTLGVNRYGAYQKYNIVRLGKEIRINRRKYLEPMPLHWGIAG